MNPDLTQNYSTGADAACLAFLILLAALQARGARKARQLLPRLAAPVRAAVRTARIAAGRLTPRPAAAPAPLTVTVQRGRVLPDPLAVPPRLAPWDRLTPEQAETWFRYVLADLDEPFLTVRDTGSFPAVGHADTITMAAV